MYEFYVLMCMSQLTRSTTTEFLIYAPKEFRNVCVDSNQIFIALLLDFSLFFCSNQFNEYTLLFISPEAYTLHTCMKENE